MALILKRKTPPPLITPEVAPVQLTAPEPIKSKVVLKFGGAKPMPRPLPATQVAVIVEEPLTERQKQKLIDSGLMEPEEKKWDAVPVDTRVVITNDKFPWVKHYKPGDKGIVTRISQANSLQDDKTGRYLSHIIKIDQPLDKSRIGQTAMLFRWEFEPCPQK